MTSYKRYIATIDFFRTVSEIDGDFSLKSHFFPPPCILRHTEGVFHGIGYRRWGSKTGMMGLSGRERSLKISSGVWIYNPPTCQTNPGQMPPSQTPPGHLPPAVKRLLVQMLPSVKSSLPLSVNDIALTVLSNHLKQVKLQCL